MAFHLLFIKRTFFTIITIYYWFMIMKAKITQKLIYEENIFVSYYMFVICIFVNIFNGNVRTLIYYN